MRNHEPFRKLYMQIKAFCSWPVRVFFLFFLSLIFITFADYSACFIFHFLDFFPFSFSPLLFPFFFILSSRSSCSSFQIMLSSYEDDFWFRHDGKKLSFQQANSSCHWKDKVIIKERKAPALQRQDFSLLSIMWLIEIVPQPHYIYFYKISSPNIYIFFSVKRPDFF